MDEQPRQQALIGEIQDLLLDSPDVQDFLEDLAGFAAKSLSRPGDEVFCGITLLRDRTAGTVASSGAKAQLQAALRTAYIRFWPCPSNWPAKQPRHA